VSQQTFRPSANPGVRPAQPHPRPRVNGQPQPPAANGSTDRPVPAGAFEACQECGAPMSRQQRYCVNCAARRPGADNPASQYFAAASRWRRRGGVKQEQVVKKVGKPAAVAALALLPVAIAAGVLIGRGNSGSGVDDDALLAALNSGPAVAATATTGDTGATETPVADTGDSGGEVLKSDFSLDDGYTVKIDLLPVSSTNNQSATAAKSAAQKKGAKDVGVINPSDFQLKPDQGTENYILYSGEFKSKGEADSALAKLKKDFPKAEVVEVHKPTTDSIGTVVAQTDHGVVHDVTKLDPTQEQIDKSTELVQDLAQDTGKSYIEQQSSLPDVIPVGGDPEDAPPLPTGGGD